MDFSREKSATSMTTYEIPTRYQPVGESGVCSTHTNTRQDLFDQHNFNIVDVVAGSRLRFDRIALNEPSLMFLDKYLFLLMVKNRLQKVIKLKARMP